MNDHPTARIGRNNQSRNPKTITVFVNLSRRDVIVKTAVIIPNDDDHGILPITTFHHGINQASDIPHALLNILRRMLSKSCLWDDPANLREGPSLYVLVDLCIQDQVR